MTKSTKNKREDGPRNEERRRFMETTAKFGVTAALVVGAAGALTSSEAAAQTAKEEKARQSDAKWTMTIGTAYRIGTTRSYPIMQLNFKENIQNLTRGQIYVKLAPAGQLGVGTKLAEKVQSGTIQAAQHSLSNFAPFASAVDLINLPYWCGENQKFVNLVTSAAWEQEVNSRVKAKGFKPLFYFCIDPRTAAKRRGLGDEPFRTPQDLQGHQVPGAGLKDPAAVLPPPRGQPDPGCLGRDPLGDQAGRGRRSRPGGRGALCLRLQGHPVLGHLQPARCRTARSIPAIWNGSRACRRTCAKASTSPAR